MPLISRLTAGKGGGSPLQARTVLVVALGVLLLVAGVCFGSYQIPDKELTARRGTFSFVSRDLREAFVGEYRSKAGPAAAGACALLSAGWAAAESLARSWQKRRNLELAGVAGSRPTFQPGDGPTGR
jgi:hypothetical protein